MENKPELKLRNVAEVFAISVETLIGHLCTLGFSRKELHAGSLISFDTFFLLDATFGEQTKSMDPANPKPTGTSGEPNPPPEP